VLQLREAIAQAFDLEPKLLELVCSGGRTTIVCGVTHRRFQLCAELADVLM
jgi:hypothetical protein